MPASSTRSAPSAVHQLSYITMTASELDAAIGEAMVRDETFDAKAARHDAMGDYIRTRNAIIARIKAEKEAK